MYPFYLDLLKGPRSECNPIKTDLSDRPELLRSSEIVGPGEEEMEKDVVEQGSTWKSDEKSKAEMREERKWEERKEECIIICLL